MSLGMGNERGAGTPEGSEMALASLDDTTAKGRSSDASQSLPFESRPDWAAAEVSSKSNPSAPQRTIFRRKRFVPRIPGAFVGKVRIHPKMLVRRGVAIN